MTKKVIIIDEKDWNGIPVKFGKKFLEHCQEYKLKLISEEEGEYEPLAVSGLVCSLLMSFLDKL